MAKASERAKKLYFQCAREQMAPYHNVMHTFSGSVGVFPGVTSVPLHGHTPSHSGYMISSGKDSLLIWGDIVRVPEIQIPRPEVNRIYRSARRSGNAKAGARHGGYRSPAGGRNAYALPRLCSCAKARGQLSHVAEALGTKRSDQEATHEAPSKRPPGPERATASSQPTPWAGLDSAGTKCQILTTKAVAPGRPILGASRSVRNRN